MKKLIIKRLLWDSLNTDHVADHDVMPDEVQAACKSKPVVRKGHKNRLFLIGITKQGRLLTVILQPTAHEGVYRPITAYEASKTSARTYHEEKGGEQAA
jgi:uncharacterized DUF497 family protein